MEYISNASLWQKEYGVGLFGWYEVWVLREVVGSHPGRDN